MFMEFFNTILPTFQNFGALFYWFIFSVAIIEALPFIGTIFPGATLVTIAGLLSGQGYYNFIDLIWVVGIGAIVGDIIAYWLGTKGTTYFKLENKILKLSHLDKGKVFFKKYGEKSVFFGRFIGVVRSVIPFIAGLTRMDFKQFLFWNILSGFSWSLVYLTLGNILGRYVPRVDILVDKISIISVALFSIGVIAHIFWKKIKKDSEKAKRYS